MVANLEIIAADVENDKYIKVSKPTEESELLSRYTTHIYNKRKYRIVIESKYKDIFYFADTKNNVDARWILHREDGPAIEEAFEFCEKKKSYYLEGKNYEKEEWFSLLTSEQRQYAVWNL